MIERKQVDEFISSIVSALGKKEGVSNRLYEAVEYVTSSSGKRIRSLLMLVIADALKVDYNVAVIPAISLELIHNYTIVHDDLPSMDNDQLRRGAPSCHVKFGEGIALLAGNAIFTLALQVLNDGLQDKPAVLCDIMKVLLRASGIYGILSGQSEDLLTKGLKIESEDDIMKLLDISYMKTAVLFEAAFVIPGIISGFSEKNLLSECGITLGMLYQIEDDIQDRVLDESLIFEVRSELLQKLELCIYELELILPQNSVNKLRAFIFDTVLNKTSLSQS